MNRQEIEQLLQNVAESPGCLLSSGWLRSLAGGEAVNEQGAPIPWVTYPALAFLEPRITSQMAIFEFGSGNSTLWWSARVRQVVSCEHDKEWYAEMHPRVPANVTHLYRRVKGGCSDYANEISRYEHCFEVVVIDGRDRVNCCRQSLPALTPDGVILWDNSDRKEYQEGYSYLRDNGFSRLDFWGMGPLSSRCWCTSVFYRPQNCLGI